MTAITYAGRLRRPRRGSKRATACHWKAAVVGHGIVALVGLFALNGIYQLIRKPGELLAPVSAAFSKSPESTWQSYGRLFEKHSTSIVSSEFLAALAQLESSGNPVARTYWRWRWSWNPLEIYRPASSALGMFQITDGTFAEARNYCIHDHRVVTQGPWREPNSCWFNGFYTRLLPSHAIELTAAYLHQSVSTLLAAARATRASLAQKQRLAAVIHLCGTQRGAIFARQGFRARPGERCGDHNLGRYIGEVERMKARFARLGAPDQSRRRDGRGRSKGNLRIAAGD
jgi:hypothetical protein